MYKGVAFKLRFTGWVGWWRTFQAEGRWPEWEGCWKDWRPTDHSWWALKELLHK